MMNNIELNSNYLKFLRNRIVKLNKHNMIMLITIYVLCIVLCIVSINCVLIHNKYKVLQNDFKDCVKTSIIDYNELQEENTNLKNENAYLKETMNAINAMTTIGQFDVEQENTYIEANDNVDIPLEENDLELLARVMHAEASHVKDIEEEDLLLVGNVVLNRVNDESFKNTIYDVIYSPGQYATADMLDNVTPNELAYKCAQRLLNGERFCPENVVYQAQFKQGSGVWKKLGSHYYCYK